MLARMQQWVSVFWIGGTLAWLAAFASAGRPWTALVGALVMWRSRRWTDHDVSDPGVTL